MQFKILSSVLLAMAFSESANAGVSYAQQFSIQDKGTHQILSVKSASEDKAKMIRYALVPKTGVLPKLPEDVNIVRTPVERVVIMETVYIGYLEAIDQLNSVIGAGTTAYITNKVIREGVENEQIEAIEVGQALDIEQLILLQPDLIFTSSSSDPTSGMPAQLARSGLPIAITAGYTENHPLARAEWIKFIAAFYEADEIANTFFEEVETEYDTLKALTGELNTRPSVFVGAPYSGIWHVAAGQSFTAQATRDAGGDYLWSDVQRSGAIALDTERVFLKAADADIWLNPSFFKSLNELFSADPRFKKFNAASADSVFNNTKQVGESGGNAIWESGVVRPDWVLADMIKIFHPELLPEHEFVFYEQLK